MPLNLFSKVVKRIAGNCTITYHIHTTFTVITPFWGPWDLSFDEIFRILCTIYSRRLSQPGSDGCCGFFGLFGHVLKVVLPNILPVCGQHLQRTGVRTLHNSSGLTLTFKLRHLSSLFIWFIPRLSGLPDHSSCFTSSSWEVSMAEWGFKLSPPES